MSRTITATEVAERLRCIEYGLPPWVSKMIDEGYVKLKEEKVKFEIEIKQVQNGFIVYKTECGDRNFPRSMWVARDIVKLQVLIGDLHAEFEKANSKKCECK